MTDEYRLPRNVVPRSYQLRLEPDLATATFAGSETIKVDVVEAVDRFVLNAADLDLTSVSVRVGGETLSAEVELDEKQQRATLRFPRTIDSGEAELDIEFCGVLNDQLQGFYRSTFTDVDGVEQTVATTQFEATDARRAFPCWDEPDFKASFQVTIVIPNDLLVVSNTMEESRQAIGDKVEVRFAETMVMSTYLVAFVVGPFEATEPIDVDGTPVRIVTPKGKLHLAPYALECAVFCLRYLSDYYEIPYPSDKVDHIAIPDFAFGAMENLGCITYREAALLLDGDRATQAEKIRILDVVGHELAHMWFGDLVTMKWWDGIWLNEAFATFMEMKATDAMRPEWKRWLTFGAVDRPWALEIDQLSTSRPVEFEVHSPDEASEMFDALTYGKGSSVLRMIEQFIGEGAFRNGVGSYLRAHAYGNTVTADLWAGLDGASEWPVGEIMDTWILQPGYPQVEVDATGSGVRLRQRRFLAIPDDSDTSVWKVPVQIRGVAGGETFERRVLLDDVEMTIDLPGQVEWVVANAGGHGFYRVSYSAQLFDALVARLQELKDLERYVLLDDANAFVLSGQLDAPSVLRLLEAYADETEQAIWQLVLRVLASTEHHAIPDEQLDRFHRLVQRLLSPTAEQLGWDPRPDESDLTRRLRGQMLLALGGRLGRSRALHREGCGYRRKGDGPRSERRSRCGTCGAFHRRRQRRLRRLRADAARVQERRGPPGGTALPRGRLSLRRARVGGAHCVTHPRRDDPAPGELLDPGADPRGARLGDERLEGDPLEVGRHPGCGPPEAGGPDPRWHPTAVIPGSGAGRRVVLCRGRGPRRNHGGATAPRVAPCQRRVEGAGDRESRRLPRGGRELREGPQGPPAHFSSMVAPAPSRSSFALSAASLSTPSSTALGALSTNSFASRRPRLVSVRTSLIT